MIEREFTGEEIVADLNKKFCVAVISEESRIDFPTVVLELAEENDSLIVGYETFWQFRKRFPRKLSIDGKLRNAGWFWLHHPRRRQEACVLFLVRERKSKKKEKKA